VLVCRSATCRRVASSLHSTYLENDVKKLYANDVVIPEPEQHEAPLMIDVSASAIIVTDDDESKSTNTTRRLSRLTPSTVLEKASSAINVASPLQTVTIVNSHNDDDDDDDGGGGGNVDTINSSSSGTATASTWRAGGAAAHNANTVLSICVDDMYVPTSGSSDFDRTLLLSQSDVQLCVKN
jgi:hypothetical protein